MEQTTITVLLSTYNGDKYLEEQLDSVLNQKNVDVYLIIRDDGSIDETRDILLKYSNCYPNITLILDSNVGVEESFHKLCFYAYRNTTSQYYAFCDQDDVWEENKLYEAIKLLNQLPNTLPNLYFSNLKVVEEDLSYREMLFDIDEVFIAKNKMFVRFFSYGCTCVFNLAALKCYCIIENNKSLHDIWIYVISSFLGNVIYDDRSFIKYRQHSNNASGKKLRGLNLLYSRFKRLLKGHLGHTYEQTAQQMLQYYSTLITPEDREIIDRIANYRKKIRYKLSLLFDRDFNTKSFQKNVCIKFRIIFNHL